MLELAGRTYEDDSLRILGTTRRAYVIPELKLLYISLAKNACTSIKWLMAELAGEDLESLVPAAGYFPNREAGIHDRYAWRKTPRLHELPDGVRASISPENGWMIFTVLLIFWLLPGVDRETSIFGLTHGIGYIALCILIWIAILRHEAPYTLLAATLTPVGPLGSVIAIEVIERDRKSVV